MGRDKDRLFRYTKKDVSYETTLFFVTVRFLWKRFVWCMRRLKPLAYHPVAVAGLTVLLWSYITSPWLTAVLFWALLIYQRVWPYSYLKHVQPRVMSAVVTLRYRTKLRKKLAGNGLINDKDPLPLISYIRKRGCVTVVRIRMSYGDDKKYWMERAKRIAQTFGALDCMIKPYRRNSFWSIRFRFLKRWPFVQWRFTEKVTKARWLELEFLTKNPFGKPIPVDYIDHYLNPADPLPAIGNAAAMRRDGTPARHAIDRGLLLVGLTGRGKSNALRCHVYADRYAIYRGLLELWGLDGKGGVEISYMRHLFGRYCFGDGDNPERFYAEGFAAITDDAVRIMMRRLKKIRELGDDVVHTATRGEPALRLIVDEMLIFAAEFIPGNVQNKIFSNIALVQRLGRAAKVTVYGCAQDPRKADLPNRGGFTDFRVFKVNDPLDVDLAMGRGAHQRGANADDIPFDQEGTCYEDTDYGGTPEELRYPVVTNAEIKGLPSVSEVLGYQSAFPLFPQPIWTQAPPEEVREPGRKRQRSKHNAASNGHAAPEDVIIEPDEEPTGERELLAIGAGPGPWVRRMRDRAKPRKAE